MTSQVQGICPACGSKSLFLGDGGYVTCSWVECKQPDAATELLEREDPNPGYRCPEIHLTPSPRQLYEFSYHCDTQIIHHMWLTENEAAVANFCLDKESSGFAKVTPCPEDCDYQQIPTPFDQA